MAPWYTAVQGCSAYFLITWPRVVIRRAHTDTMVVNKKKHSLHLRC